MFPPVPCHPDDSEPWGKNTISTYLETQNFKQLQIENMRLKIPRDFNGIRNNCERFQKKVVNPNPECRNKHMFSCKPKKGMHLHIFRLSQRSPKTRPPNVDQLCLLSSPETSSSELQTAMARCCAAFMSWLTCSSRPDWWSFTLVSKENVQN